MEKEHTAIIPAAMSWHDDHWFRFNQRMSSNTMPHAILLTGPAGVGKLQFARRLVAALLCSERGPAGDACGQCRHCRLLQNESHPDFVTVAREDKKKNISIDQVRELAGFLQLSRDSVGYNVGYKVALIPDAEAMSVSAANSLLKNLEEPQAGRILLLLSDRPQALPATIRSRCQRFEFTTPPGDVALAWLARQDATRGDWELLLSLSHGAPLLALELAQSGLLANRREFFADWLALVSGQGDGLKLASQSPKQNAHGQLYWLYGWTVDLIRLKAAGTQAKIQNIDLAAELERLAAKLEWGDLYGGLDRCGAALASAQTTINVQLLMEDVLLSWDGRVGAAG